MLKLIYQFYRINDLSPISIIYYCILCINKDITFLKYHCVNIKV